MDKQGFKLLNLYRSPIGKKIVTGITGLGLTLFVLMHMTGNLSYFSSDPNAYNAYAHFLTGLGPLFYAVELGLLAFFIFHITLGINIYLGKRKARPVAYEKYQSAGKPSMQSLSSRSMAVTGLILMVFLVFHIWAFKYGPGMAEGYTASVDGVQIRDLKRLMEEKFSNPLYAFGYTGMMLLLAVHLRHGVWSAFQSLGATKPKLTPLIYLIGGVIAVFVAVGFLVLPLWIYFG